MVAISDNSFRPLKLAQFAVGMLVLALFMFAVGVGVYSGHVVGFGYTLLTLSNVMLMTFPMTFVAVSMAWLIVSQSLLGVSGPRKRALAFSGLAAFLTLLINGMLLSALGSDAGVWLICAVFAPVLLISAAINAVLVFKK